MKNAGHFSAGRHQGVALIAVLWIVAALGIIVTGISYSVRSELRQVSMSREMVQSKGRAEAAMVLVLQQMSASAERPKKLMTINVMYEGQTVDVQVMPMNGLIDINNAPEPLLARLFEGAAGMQPQAAEELAKGVLDARVAPGKNGRAVRFDAIQDLLRLPGMEYELYARLAPLITVDAGGSGKVNPLAAPEAVLQAIAGGASAASVAGFIARREIEVAGLDTTMFDGSLVDTAATQRFQLLARVPLISGSISLVTCNVDMSVRPRDGMPWRISYCGHQFETNSGKEL